MKNFWQRWVKRLKGATPDEALQAQHDRLAAIPDQIHGLHAELDRVTQRVAHIGDEGNRLLTGLHQRIAEAADDGAGRLAELQQRIARAGDEGSGALTDLQQRIAQAADEDARKLADIRRDIMQAGDDGARTLTDLQQRVIMAANDGVRKLAELRDGMLRVGDERVAELAELRQQIERAYAEDARRLADLQQHVESMASEHNRLREQIQEFRDELHEATAGQERAETLLRALDRNLKLEHSEQLEFSQRIRHRESELGRRTDRTLWIAGAALLLGVASGSAMLWTVRNNDRMLAAMDKDIGDIKRSMAQAPANVSDADKDGAADAPAAAIDDSSLAAPEVQVARPPPTDAPELPEPVVFATGLPALLNGLKATRADTHAFFEQNAAQEGVVSLPSGLQYRILSRGSGSKPDLSSTVVVNYRAFLADGTEVNSAYADRDPEIATFKVAELTPGWKEALQRMEEGAQWELYIPPELASAGGTRKRSLYGYQPLIYVIELKSVIDGS